MAALAPVDLSEDDLPAALTRVVNRFGRESGVRTELVVTGTATALPPRTEVVLLCSAQEALTNVGKHAGASQVRVRLDYHGGTASLRLEDDGIGIGTAEEGFGLRGMRDRAAAVGGSVRVSDSAEGGTRIEVVGEAGDGAEAIAEARALRPDVVLMDLRMPGMDGASATEATLAELPATRVLVLTTYDTDRDIVRAGYLLKDTPRRAPGCL